MSSIDSHDLAPREDALFGDLSSLIERARIRAASAVNSELVMLYWRSASAFAKRCSAASGRRTGGQS